MDIFHFDYNFEDNRCGFTHDLNLFKEEQWLGESVVGYLVEVQPKDWMISLVFVSKETPLKFMIKKLERAPSFEKAQQYQSLAAKTAKLLKECYQRELN
jgi:hypothetical protein